MSILCEVRWELRIRYIYVGLGRAGMRIEPSRGFGRGRESARQVMYSDKYSTVRAMPFLVLR